VTSVVANAPPSVQLKEIRLGLNLLDMLVSRELLSSSRVVLVGTKLSVTRKQDGSIAIVGLKAGMNNPYGYYRAADTKCCKVKLPGRMKKERVER